jgi:NADPH:quinone reductase-like Zn-dependent oxidoreductase
LGADGAGTVNQLGEGRTNLKVGDRVIINPGLSCGVCPQCRAGEQSQCVDFSLLGVSRDGTFAEYVKVPIRNVYPAPSRLSFQEAAAFPLVFLTAWRMLFTRAQLKPGETVLIHGIGGGVSTAALQLSKLAGANVIVTSSSDKKLDKAMRLGANCRINYNRQDVLNEVLKHTDSQGVDVVIDSIGLKTWKTSLQALSKGGRLVTNGVTTGPNPEANIGLIYWKQISVLGSTMGSDEEMRSLLRLLNQTQIKPIIDSVYPLAQAAKAEERLKQGEQMGKIVLKM